MTKEEVYDAVISPLMAKIIEQCKESRISLIADFGLDDDMHCTSALLAEEYQPSDKQLTALALLKPKLHFALAETITTNPDGSKSISIRRIP